MLERNYDNLVLEQFKKHVTWINFGQFKTNMENDKEKEL